MQEKPRLSMQISKIIPTKQEAYVTKIWAIIYKYTLEVKSPFCSRRIS